ncbi:hypothetical protein HDU86_007853 [Geranomyces michiganensis]|nr:hypothetical protein HDU86_007853 [Geranomyces michiganensis]
MIDSRAAVNEAREANVEDTSAEETPHDTSPDKVHGAHAITSLPDPVFPIPDRFSFKSADSQSNQLSPISESDRVPMLTGSAPSLTISSDEATTAGSLKISPLRTDISNFVMGPASAASAASSDGGSVFSLGYYGAGNNTPTVATAGLPIPEANAKPTSPLRTENGTDGEEAAGTLRLPGRNARNGADAAGERKRARDNNAQSELKNAGDLTDKAQAAPAGFPPDPSVHTLLVAQPTHSKIMGYTALSKSGGAAASSTNRRLRRAKLYSLLALVLQNTTLVFVLRRSRTQPVPYIASTAVFLAELVKLAVSTILHLSGSAPQERTLARLRAVVCGRGAMGMAVPAAAYALQNWLQFVAIARLDAPTFQVAAQMKILATAVCFVVILKRRLVGAQWVALCFLTVGVILCQLQGGSGGASGGDAVVVPAPAVDLVESEEEFGTVDKDAAPLTDQGHDPHDRFIGFLCMLLAATLSGLAGVWFEKLLKAPPAAPSSSSSTRQDGSSTNPPALSTPRPGIWVRNIQLSLFSLATTAAFGLGMLDGKEIAERGFWAGYGVWPLFAVACSAAGGIIVALVVQAADNVVKGFATSIAIVLSTILAALFSNPSPSAPSPTAPAFMLGTTLVVTATVIYAKASSSSSASAGGSGARSSDIDGDIEGDKLVLPRYSMAER